MSNVSIQHTRGLGYCRKGAKKFLEDHGFDWKTFLFEGIPEEELLKVDDAMVTNAVEYMRKMTDVKKK